MLREECHIGQKVYFGRSRGEKTLAKIVKLNQMKAKVITLEPRGSRELVGQEWGVPYSMLRPEGLPTPPQREKLVYNPFVEEDNLILEAICICYSGLSPENLSMDGEASAAYIHRTREQLTRKLRGLQAALGYTVGELEAYDWSDSKAKYLSEHKTQ